MCGGSMVHGSFTGSLKGLIFFTLMFDSLRTGSIRRPSGLMPKKKNSPVYGRPTVPIFFPRPYDFH